MKPTKEQLKAWFAKEMNSPSPNARYKGKTPMEVM